MRYEVIVYPQPWDEARYRVGKVYTWRDGALLIRAECVERDDERRCFRLREISREVIFGDMHRLENWHTPPSNN